MRRQQQNKPMRRCIACYTSLPQDEMLRFTLTDGKMLFDDGEKSDGRGYYICNTIECLELAIKKKAFNRVCKGIVDPDTIREVAMEVIGNTKEGR